MQIFFLNGLWRFFKNGHLPAKLHSSASPGDLVHFYGDFDRVHTDLENLELSGNFEKPLKFKEQSGNIVREF